MKTRILHTMIRVGNIDRSIDFYTRVLGMTLLRKNGYLGGQFILTLAGYGNEADSVVTELTHNWGVSAYEIGTGYGRIVVEADNAHQAYDSIRNSGGQVIRETGPMKHGTTMIVLVIDLDGYKIELTQKSS